MSSPFDTVVKKPRPASRSPKAASAEDAETPERLAPDADAKLRSGHRSRLRARFLAEPSAVQDYEVLELLLGYVRVRHDNKMLAKRLLQRFGSLNGVLSASDAERGLVPDSGQGVDVFCALIREIIARSAQSAVQKRAKVSLFEIASAAAGRLRLCNREEVWAALMDKQGRLITYIKIRQGSRDHVALEASELAELMFSHHADSMVLMHNHPSGSHLPSKADREFTARIDTVFVQLGMQLHDHLIITSEHCFSIKLDRCLKLAPSDTEPRP